MHGASCQVDNHDSLCTTLCPCIGVECVWLLQQLLWMHRHFVVALLRDVRNEKVTDMGG